MFLPIFSDWLKLISSSVMEDSCDTYSMVIWIKAPWHLWSYLFVKRTVWERFESGEGQQTSPAAHGRQRLQNDICVKSLKQHKTPKTTPAKVAGFVAGFSEKVAKMTTVVSSLPALSWLLNKARGKQYSRWPVDGGVSSCKCVKFLTKHTHHLNNFLYSLYIIIKWCK